MKIEEIRNYCLNCVNKPCSNKGCPLGNDIPTFIHEEDTKKAFEAICKTTVLPALCGKICPHTKQCQGSCIRGIKGESVSIGEIESYIGDKSLKEGYQIPKEIEERLTDKKVAIIGSGPAGLTCAAFLAKKGIHVKIYEKHSKLGGLLVYGIPDFRLDRKIVQDTIEKILELGIEFETNKELGKDISLQKLTKEYDAVCLAIGANEPNITLEGKNVLSGNKLLEEINAQLDNKNKVPEDTNKQSNDKSKVDILENQIPDFRGKKVAVSGGGNVAMDASRTLVRYGADVTVIYRRAEEQMPAERKEIEEAKEEGVKFLFLNNIVSVDSKNNKIECIKTELIQKEGETRLSPVDIEGSNYIMDMDYVILATGSKVDTKLIEREKIETDKYGYARVDNTHKTSREKVYAVGDLIGTKATVAFAARSGRDTAKSIIEDFLRT